MAYGKGSVNKVILVGRLGRNPEMRYTPSGAAVATFSIATDLSWKDKDSGNEKTVTEWHRVIAWRKTGEIANQYLKKGNQVYIEGRLQTRKWTDQNGTDRFTTEVVAENLVLIGSKNGSNRVPAPEQEFPNESDAAVSESINDDMPEPAEDDLAF